MHATPDCLVITAQTREEVDAALNNAMEVLKPAAVTERVGISVTRLAPGRYEARLNRGVPAGVITEMWGNERR